MKLTIKLETGKIIELTTEEFYELTEFIARAKKNREEEFKKEIRIPVEPVNSTKPRDMPEYIYSETFVACDGKIVDHYYQEDHNGKLSKITADEYNTRTENPNHGTLNPYEMLKGTYSSKGVETSFFLRPEEN